MLKQWGSDGQETDSEKKHGRLILLLYLAAAVIISLIVWLIPAFVINDGYFHVPPFWMSYVRGAAVIFYILLVILIPLAIRFDVIRRKGASNIIYISSLAGACAGSIIILATQIFTDINYIIYVPGMYFEHNGIILSGLGVCFIVLLLIKIKLSFHSKLKQNRGVFGSSEFATVSYLKSNDFYNRENSLFGKDDKGNYLYNPLCNRTIISMSGGGKTAGITIPALLTENRPVFVHDPKGELWAVTARHRMEKFGRKIILFDPFGVTTQEPFTIGKPNALLVRHSINPFSYFLRNDVSFRDRFITSLTSSIVKQDVMSKYGTHFDDVAKVLIGGIIDLLLTNENSNFVDIYNVISGGPEKIRKTITDFAKNEGISHRALTPHVKDALAVLDITGQEEMGSIFTTTLRQVRWLSDSNMRSLFQENTCDLKEFIRGDSDVYIVLPEDQIKEQGRVVRLILTLTASLLIQTDRDKLSSRQYLFLLDELGQLGYSEEIENYLEILRGRNCIFWSVFQTYSQIKQYQKPDLFINSKMLQLFSCSDPEIMHLIQKLGGMQTVSITTVGDNAQKMKMFTGSTSKSTHETGTDLIKFNEIRELSFDKQLVFIQGMRPIKCDKTFYFEEKSLMKLSDPNPMELGTKT